MKHKKNKRQEVNFVKTSLADFVDQYNQNIPKVFPRASLKALEEFRATHASLFKDGEDWTIDRHRKKLMDWLTSYSKD